MYACVSEIGNGINELYAEVNKLLLEVFLDLLNLLPFLFNL